MKGPRAQTSRCASALPRCHSPSFLTLRGTGLNEMLRGDHRCDGLFSPLSHGSQQTAHLNSHQLRMTSNLQRECGKHGNSQQYIWFQPLGRLPFACGFKGSPPSVCLSSCKKRPGVIDSREGKFLMVPSPFFLGILQPRNLQNCRENGWLLKRTMVEKNGWNQALYSFQQLDTS